ncbi:MAG: hypothetical protein NWF07_04120 [Candidatus Bathyarchaeota archaeon]|nr:hypothetical protein [Candidatus Bathyarchaeota archaeon]
MADRSFFDVRYTLPGYTFIIFLTFTLSGFPYEDTITNIVTLAISGAPIGFLISQLWYFLLYQSCWQGSYGRKDNPRVYMRYLHQKLGVSKRYDPSSTVLDYLYHLCKNETLKGHVDRRWDLYNIMGSSFIAVLLGLLVGHLWMCDPESIIKHDFSVIISNINFPVLLLGYITLCLFKGGMEKVVAEHDHMTLTILQNVIENKEFENTVFFEGYFDTSKDNKYVNSNICSILISISSYLGFTKKSFKSEMEYDLTNTKSIKKLIEESEQKK